MPLTPPVCCTISGHVRAVAGGPLVAARIVARDVVTARSISATTDRAGAFSLALRPGTYRVTGVEPGFAPTTVTVTLAADATLAVALESLDSPRFRQIGSVTVDGRLAPSDGSVPSIERSRAELDAFAHDRAIEALADLPGATISRPSGGAASGIAVVSLRGPDPSESLVALDGQLLNDGNTGDLDLSRLPVAAFSGIDVTEGLGPEDSSGSNTFGGAIDFESLRPTASPHESASYSLGSFGRSDAWIAATGPSGRLGYAGVLDDQNESGYANRTVRLFSAADPACAPCATHLGSSVAAHTALGSLTWTFSQRADVTARAFVLGDDRDQSAALNGIDRNAADLGRPVYGAFTGPGPETFAQTIRAYQVRARAPLGAGELATSLSESDDGVAVAGGATSPYDIAHVDRRFDAALSWQRTLATAQYAVGGSARYESLSFAAPPAADGSAVSAFQNAPRLGQSIGVFFARGGFEPAPRVRLDAGVFASHYSTFGSNLDGRLGAIYTPAPGTQVRFSLGTAFRAPLLIERYAFPYSQLALDGNEVFVGQGSENERPERATEYELGASRRLSADATFEGTLYRTSLRSPVEVFYPLAAVDAGTCRSNGYATPNPACVSSQGNVGNAVYEGAELALTRRFARVHLLATARYALGVAYPDDLNAQFANPTSGGTLVDRQQFLGIPQQRASLEVSYANHGAHAAASASVRGKNNELGQGPFAIVSAAAGHRFGADLDVSLAATNLTSAVSGPFTRFGAGAPYPGVGGPLPTDARSIEPAGVRLIVTIRR